MKRIISIILNFIFNFFPIQQNKIVFESGRDLIDGNPKAIYDYITANKIKNFKMIWIVSKNTNVSSLKKNEYVFYKTIISYYHLATAKYWIRSQSLGGLLKKKKNQIYIQLWHGNGAMKKMGYDSQTIDKKIEMKHVSDWDYYIANDELDARHIKTSTAYNGKFEILGMACFDTTLKLLKDRKFKQNLLDILNIQGENRNKKIILYAPTFRDFELKQRKITVPIKKLSNLDEYIILVRLHPLVRDKIDTSIFEYKNMINACNYPDASDLLAISDILITDYSSIFYQYSPLGKPIIFYPYDFDKYVKLRGGFYLDYNNELPGVICYNEKSLFDTINNIKTVYNNYKTKQQVFNDKYNYYADGNSSKRFVNKLINGEFKDGR